MYRLFVLVAACAFVLTHFPAVRAQDAPPTTSPSPQSSETLVGGQVVYTPPPSSDEWKSLGKSSDDRRVGYGLGEHRAQIVIAISPQQQGISETERHKLGALLKTQLENTIHNEAKKGNLQIVSEPTTESDPKYLVRMHDRFKVKDTPGDRLQLVRDMGKFIVTVVVTAFTEDADEAKKIQAVGEQVMLSVHPKGGKPMAVESSAGPTTTTSTGATAGAAPARAAAASAATLDKPVAFPEAHLRAAPPTGWKQESSGAASGLIVAWRDPEDATNLITLTYRPVPAEAKKDPKLRDMAIDQLAAGEKPQFQVAGAQVVGKTEMISDKRFMRKTRTTYKVKDTQFRVSFRQVRAGDGVVSITSVALVDKADAVEELADKVATEVRSTGG
ncbi:MAG TPA: hypothetical protein VH518_03035 [Tepidisphaeraceae bacterium]|jgi:hypothetical protein